MVVRSKSESELGFEHCDEQGNTPLTNLRYLLYVGGAKSNLRSVDKLIDTGRLGVPQISRVQLVSIFHTFFERRFQSFSRTSIAGEVFSLRRFYTDCDRLGINLTLNNVCDCYERFSLELWDSVLTGKCAVSATTAYELDGQVLNVIQGALELPAGVLISSFKYAELRRRGFIKAFKIDKSDLDEGFQFGADLLDVIDSFSLDSCLGELPLQLKFANGKIYEYWGNLRHPDKLRGKENRSAFNVERTHEAREKKRESGTVKSRARLIDIRIHAEFALFVAQTGFNVSIAYKLPFEDYRCTTIDGGYQVKAYKPRRGSKVEFYIYSEYREHFIEYLRFLREAFPDGCEYLFPFSIKGDKRAMAYRQTLFVDLMKSAGKKCLALKPLREKRINWLLRETHDLDFVAADAQHKVKTTVYSYSKPSFHIASQELSAFHASRRLSRPSILDGGCSPDEPEPIQGSPVSPDCVNPTGCLFCKYYQGVRSFDYIWSLMTFRYLKISELNLIPLNREIEGSPQEAVLERLEAVIKEFSSLDDECRAWRDEAEIRMQERNFHDNYRALIEVRFND